MFNSNPLAEANGNIKEKPEINFTGWSQRQYGKEEEEKIVVMKSIYGRRFQPTDQVN